MLDSRKKARCWLWAIIDMVKGKHVGAKVGRSDMRPQNREGDPTVAYGVVPRLSGLPLNA